MDFFLWPFLFSLVFRYGMENAMETYFDTFHRPLYLWLIVIYNAAWKSCMNWVISLLSRTCWKSTAKLQEQRVKVTRVVKLKLAVMESFFYNLVILIKLNKIRYLSLDKALLFPRTQAICRKNSKRWRAPTTTKFNIFLLKFSTRFLPNNVYKRVFGMFFILFRSRVINKKCV